MFFGFNYVFTGTTHGQTKAADKKKRWGQKKYRGRTSDSQREICFIRTIGSPFLTLAIIRFLSPLQQSVGYQRGSSSLIYRAFLKLFSSLLSFANNCCKYSRFCLSLCPTAPWQHHIVRSWLFAETWRIEINRIELWRLSAVKGVCVEDAKGCVSVRWRWIFVRNRFVLFWESGKKFRRFEGFSLDGC